MADPEDTTLGDRLRDLTAQQDASKKVTATFIILTGTNLVGRMFKLDGDSMLIGRAADADIWLNDEGVSRHHAKVVRLGAEVRLVDLDSKNGTLCNGEAVRNRVLRDGDKIQIGTTSILKFSYQDSLDEALQRNLYESATKDPLIGIYNKKFFTETLAKDFAFCDRHDEPLSLLMLDLDFFKQVNDTFGHPVGDKVLEGVARVVNGAIRTEDIFARYGGEEFVLLLRDTDEQAAWLVAERIRQLVEQMQVSFGGHRIKVTVSIGIATLMSRRYADADGFLAAADRHLYQAKQAGRNRVVALTPR